jgi:hypothetical protein
MPRSRVFHARMSEEGDCILHALAQYHGVSLTSAFEMLLRDTERRMADDDAFIRLLKAEKRSRRAGAE